MYLVLDVMTYRSYLVAALLLETQKPHIMIEYIFRMSDDDGFMDRNEFIEYAKKSHAVKVIMKCQ